jgi:predicted nucleic acid-binding Zn ribbon protein
MSEEAKPAKRGIGTVIKERLVAGDTNEAVLAAVKAEFPESATSEKTVSWYRNDLRRKGEKVPSAAEARKAAAAAE